MAAEAVIAAVEEVVAVAIHSSWSGEVIVRETPYSVSSVKPGRGYMVRLKGYSGAVFTVGEDSTITVGQSARMGYAINDWQLLQQELQLGMQYMARVLLAKDYGVKPGSTQTIKPKDYQNGALYRNNKGQYILYIGKAELLGGLGNREGCKYLYARIAGDTDTMQIAVANGLCQITSTGQLSVWVDSYVGKPTKLSECVWTPPAPYMSLCVNNHYAKAWRYL